MPAADPPQGQDGRARNSVERPCLRCVCACRFPPSPQPWDYGDDDRLIDAQRLFQSALNAEDVREEERLWTVLIDKLSGLKDAPWRDDTLARVYGNRGNARGRQGKLQEALKDYEFAQARSRSRGASAQPTSSTLSRCGPPSASSPGRVLQSRCRPRRSSLRTLWTLSSTTGWCWSSSGGSRRA